MIFIVLIVFGLLALSDFPSLIKDKKWYEVTALSCLYVLTITLASLMTFGVTLPSPIKGIEKFIVDVLHLGYPKP
jgi:hypothetical protein